MRIDEILLREAPEDGTYAGVRFWGEDVKKLEAFVAENNIPNPLPSEDYHSTLLFSKVPVPDYEPHGLYKMSLTAMPIDVKLWGEDEEKALVIILDCPQLVKRHEYLMKKHPEATWDHPEFIPHVTLSYDAGDFDISKLNVKDIGMLSIVEEYSDDIVPDWEKNKI